MAVRAGESRLVFWFFFYYLCIGVFVILAATVSDALFFTHVSADTINTLYAWARIGIAATTLLIAWFYHRLVRHVPRVPFLLAIHGLLFCSMFGFRYLLDLHVQYHQQRWVLFALLIWLKVCSRVLIMMFFSFAGDYFTTRDAKRVYGYIAGGLTVGVIVAGVTIQSLVALIGTENLLYACAGMVGAAAGCLVFIQHIGTPVARLHAAPASAGTPSASPGMFSQRYLRIVFLMVLISVICFVLVEFHMKIVVKDVYAQSADLARFFGRFYLAAGAVTLAFQLFLSRALLQHFGTISCLMLLPAMYAATSGLVYASGSGLLAASLLNLLVLTNFARIVLSDAIDAPSREMLLLPLPPSLRVQGQALMSGMMSSVGQMLGGLLILSFTVLAIPAFQYALIVCASALGWIGLLWLLRPRYHGLLIESLQKAQLDPTDLQALGQDQPVQNLAGPLLRSGDEALIDFALEMLHGRIPDDVMPDIQALARGSQPALAAKAIHLLGTRADGDVAPTLEHALHAPSAQVRNAAVLALWQRREALAFERLDQWLHDPALFEAALLGAARYGGRTERDRIRALLDHLCASRMPAEREQAARLIGAIGQPAYETMLLALLNDSHPAVQQAAAEACGKTGCIRAIPRLIAWLPRPAVCDVAMTALKQMPAAGAEPVLQALYAPEADEALHTMLFQILGAIGGERAWQSLWVSFAAHRPVALRLAAGRELQRLLLQGAAPAIPHAEFRRTTASCSERLRRLNTACRAIAASDHLFWQLVHDHALLEIESLFLVLSYHYGVRRIRQIQYNFSGPATAQRANALELLDELLPRRVAATIIPLLEDSRLPGSAARAALPFPEMPDAEPWLRVVLAYFADHANGAPAADLTAYEERLYQAMPDVLLLKHIPLFKHVPGNYLVSVARILKPVSIPAGAFLFQQGEPGEAMYLIRRGAISVRVGERDIARRESGECLGEISILDGAPRSASCVALEDTDLFMLHASDLEPLLVNQSSVALALLQTLAARLRYHTRHAAQSDAPPASPFPSAAAQPASASARPEARTASLYRQIQWLAFFQGVPLFHGMPDEYLAALTELAQPVTLRAGDYVCREGEPGDALYLLQRGTISIRIRGQEVNRLMPGESIGEMSLFDHAPRSASCLACEDVELLKMTASDFETVVRSHPGVLRALLRTVATRLRHQTG